MSLADWIDKYPRVKAFMQQEDEALEYQPDGEAISLQYQNGVESASYVNNGYVAYSIEVRGMSVCPVGGFFDLGGCHYRVTDICDDGTLHATLVTEE